MKRGKEKGEKEIQKDRRENEEERNSKEVKEMGKREIIWEVKE